MFSFTCCQAPVEDALNFERVSAVAPFESGQHFYDTTGLGGGIAPRPKHLMVTTFEAISEEASSNPDLSCSNPEIELPQIKGCEQIDEPEKRERIRKLRCFLASTGFSGVNTPRSCGVMRFGGSLTYPLHVAVRSNNADVVALLLWAGADRSKQDSRGLSPLELAKRLAKRESHHELGMSDGQTPGVSRERTNMGHTLVARTRTPEPVRVTAISEEASGNPDSSPSNSEVELPQVTGCEQIDESERRERIRKLRCFLASTGFSGVNTPRSCGVMRFGGSLTYPLHVAVRSNNADVVALLLWAGADRSKQDSRGLSPLELAKRLAKRDSHQEVLQVLAA
mmetsp:Transcript_11559/g.32892  ORF Transcript_11559/g.32892 Transcript_11559/m.32892 type:complete len:338 (+) Transcript_11559:66-1079(+)